jgi:hypothetical protein
MSSGIPGWRYVSLFLSLIYLLFEVAFSARLLDAVGLPGQVDVRTIERWGRLLSGLALAIFIWSTWLFPTASRGHFSWRQLMPWLALSGMLSIGMMFGLQEVLVRYLVNRSSGEERQAALALTTLNSALVDGRVKFDGLPLDQETSTRILRSPEGKAMLAFIPLSAGRSEDIARRAEPVVRAIITNKIDGRLGTPADFFNTRWTSALRTLGRKWSEYEEASLKYSRLLASIPRRQNEAWNDYARSLQSRNLQPHTVPRYAYNQVRSEVRSLGASVSADWEPADRVGFNAAVSRTVRAEAEAEWRRVLQDRGALPLPPSLTIDQFFRRPEVQHEWRLGLGLPDHLTLDRRWNYDQWRTYVWYPMRDRIIDQRIREVINDASEFSDGGNNESLGRRAVESVVVPPIALIVSLLGSAAHIGKVIGSLTSLIPRVPRITPPIITIASVIGLVLIPSGHTNTALESRLFLSMHQQMNAGWGFFPAHLMRWVMQAQPIAYPIGNKVRLHVLFGIQFGVGDPPPVERDEGVADTP